MSNEEFQKVVIQEFKGLNTRLSNMEVKLENIETRVSNVEVSLGNIETRVSNMEVRQDEIYQVARSIEHSNLVGKSELDSHNIRLAKVEGKFKKVAKVCNEDNEMDKVSNF